MEYMTLNNGVTMPVIGYGTYQTPVKITEQCVAEALKVGYRSIDTAQCYGNEREVGKACRNPVYLEKSCLSQQSFGVVMVIKILFVPLKAH